MGEKLYEKASAKFSIQSTVDTQLHIYDEIIRRHNRPKRDRDGVVICGAYGRGNAGDDAILEAILQEMRSIDPDMPITVLTKDPKATRLTYRVRTAGRMDVGTWKKAMRHAGLYINGGGSLIQDVTSRRSLWFYLHNIQAAHKAGCKVQMYGCGIGPVHPGTAPEAGGQRAERQRGRHHPPGAGLPEGIAVHGRDETGDPPDGGPGPDPSRRQRGRDRQRSAAGGHPDPREVPVLRSAELEGL